VDRPLLIISPGRSGSSYTAKQFHDAGVFGGILRKGDRHNPQGYFENIKLHRELRIWYGIDWVSGPFPQEHTDWNKHVCQVMNREGYQGGPWFFKCGAFYWETFQSFNPVYVKVWRDREKILNSFKRTGMLARFGEQMPQIVDRQHEAMKSIPGIDVYI